MTATTPNRRRLVQRLLRGTEGSVSVETIIVIPMLCWALAATVVFYSGFSTRYHTQMAAQTIADIMSRETDLFTESYVDGMNDVLDYLVDSRVPTRIRVSSVIWDSTNERNRLQWSYGTRNLAALPNRTFELLESGDLETLAGLFGEDSGSGFTANANQMPVADFAQRIPPVLPGEALLIVETFAMWTPFANVGIGQLRITPVVAVRPRFAPWINFEGFDPVYPEDDYEIDWTGEDGGGDDGEEPIEPEPASVTSFTFDTSVTTGWTSDQTTDGSAVGGRFLGPFGSETYDTPIALAVNLGADDMTASIAFDLLIFDSWDGYDPTYADPRGDTISILIDGTPISLDAFQFDAAEIYGNPRTAQGTIGAARYTLEMTPTRTGDSFFGSGFADQVWRVELQLANAPRTFALGFSAGTDEPAANESFGIDNLSYGASATPDSFQTVPMPPPTDGSDPHTRFARYVGCPDPDLSAPWLSINNEDLGRRFRNGFSFERAARGTTDLSGCGIDRAVGSISAAPHLILNYDNQGLSQEPYRLQIRMDDGFDGETCDTVMVVRDPNGQWWFNDDQRGYNAGLRLGNAESGTYAIWIGTYAGGECPARINFFRY